MNLAIPGRVGKCVAQVLLFLNEFCRDRDKLKAFKAYIGKDLSCVFHFISGNGF